MVGLDENGGYPSQRQGREPEQLVWCPEEDTEACGLVCVITHLSRAYIIRIAPTYSWFLKKRKAGIKKEVKRTEKTPRAGKKLFFLFCGNQKWDGNG